MHRQPVIPFIPENYFCETTLSHLKPQQGLSERYQRRALDVTLACKLTHVYGKYHLAMLHRQLAMSEEQTTYQQAERQAEMMNQMTLFHSSPSDFLHTQTNPLSHTWSTNSWLRKIATSSLYQPLWISSARWCMRTMTTSSSSSLSATCISPSMPMRFCGISKEELTTRHSVWSFRNSVGWTEAEHLSTERG